MRRRTVIGLVAAAIAVGVTSSIFPAQAAPGNSGGNGNGNGNGAAGGNNGNSSANGNSNGDSGGQGNGNQGRGNDSDPSNASNRRGKPTGNPDGVPDHEVARRAVESGAAKPLAEIIETARKSVTGEVLDARLVTVRGFLLYELKVLSGNSVRDVYFYARSGLPVGGQ